MGRRIVLRIRTHPQMWYMMWVLIMLPFFFGLLNDFLKLPRAIRYVMDLVWVAALIVYWLRVRQKTGDLKKMAIWITAFFLYALLVYIVEFQSPLYFLWGTRNVFRFYVAFILFSTFLDQDSVIVFLRYFDWLFWVNAAVAFVQYFFFDYLWDNLGGVFGTETGVNGYTNLFFLIVLTKSLIFCIEGKESIWLCLTKSAVALITAALAEMKFFFVEFLVLVVLAVFFTKFTWRKLAIALGAYISCALGVAIISTVFSGDENWFSVRWFLEQAASTGGYTSSGDLNRLTAIPAINELWLTNGWQRLFGLGLGNCDTSSFSFINTPFYQNYGYMHYSWISYAFMYLECGWIGLIFYYGFFVLVFLGAHKIEKRSDDSIKTYCRISKIMAIVCMLIAVYNSSLRTEAGYMTYFVMAIPFALDCKSRQQKIGPVLTENQRIGCVD